MLDLKIYAIAAGLALIAQAAQNEVGMPPWLQWSTTITTGAILAWYLYYTTSVVQPRQQEEARKDREASQQHVERVVSEERASRREMAEMFRDSCREITGEVRNLPCKIQRPGE